MTCQGSKVDMRAAKQWSIDTVAAIAVMKGCYPSARLCSVLDILFDTMSASVLPFQLTVSPSVGTEAHHQPPLQHRPVLADAPCAGRRVGQPLLQATPEEVPHLRGPVHRKKYQVQRSPVSLELGLDACTSSRRERT